VKNIGLYPRVHADTNGTGVVSQVGGVALVEAVRVAGLDEALSAELSRWRKPMAIHDPGKVITDLAVTLALGGDCLADVALLRAEPAVFGAVASDPTVSRTIDALAADAKRALAAIDTAREAARARVWSLAGEHAPDHGIDADRPAGHRHRRRPDHRALGQGTGRTDVQTGIRIPPAVGLRRSRRRGHW
jgi:Transposase DDE domain group 1